MDSIERGSVFEVDILDYAFEGKGVAKIPLKEGSDKKFVMFISGAYPGDKLKVQLFKKKKTFGDAKIVEIIEAAPERVDAKCSYYGTCGGCKQQDLSYSQQLIYKKKQVVDIFERIGGLDNFEMEEIIPSENIFAYRNKMEFSFADKRWLTANEIQTSEEGEIKDRDFALGLHVPRIYDKVIDIEECFLQTETNNKILNFTREFFKSRKLSIYTSKTHSGYLRNLIIKNTHFTNDLMVNIVTSEDRPELMEEYAKELLAEIPEITTVVNNVNEKKSMVAYGDYEKVYHGDGFIYDFIGDYKFRISANSFFQTNTKQAFKLYSAALEYADFKGDEIVYDLYSGAGTITSFISKHVKEAIGFEDAESSIADAHVNEKLNNIENVRFYHANLNRSMMPVVYDNDLPKPDVIIADPPRGGMNPRTLNDIEKLSPEKLVYISCNPATQARDIKILTFKGYKLVKMIPVDMFPHTFHIENVALLVKDKEDSITQVQV